MPRFGNNWSISRSDPNSTATPCICKPSALRSEGNVELLSAPTAPRLLVHHPRPPDPTCERRIRIHRRRTSINELPRVLEPLGREVHRTTCTLARVLQPRPASVPSLGRTIGGANLRRQPQQLSDCIRFPLKWRMIGRLAPNITTIITTRSETQSRPRTILVSAVLLLPPRLHKLLLD
jgi:hypothetical protein